MTKITFILLSILLIQNLSFSQTNAKELNVESIWKNYEFSAKRFAGFKSMNDGEHFSKINQTGQDFSISKCSFKDYKGEGEIIVKREDLLFKGTFISIDEYEFNADETKMLITSNTESIYRRSYLADFFILDLKTKKLSILDDKNDNKTLADFSPDGTKIAYISNNNLFVKDLITEKIIQITKDGKRNEIINGTTDWVYEEEFAITKGFSWSPDSKKIAFLRFDESAVKEFQMAFYGTLYPYQYKFKYPKAGEDNSKVSAHIYNISSKKTQKVNLGEYEYIPRLKWSSTQNHLIIQTLNRHQNNVKYHLIDATAKTISSKVFFEEKAEAYIDIDDNLIILKDGKSLLRTSEASGYNHIQQVFFDGNSKQITSGNYDVIEFYGIDNTNTTIYYSSAEKSAIYKSIYKINLDGTNKLAISKETGYNHAEFSSGMNYFMKTYSEANVPSVFSLCNNSGEEIAVLEKNEKLIKKMGEYNFSKKEFLQIQGADGLLNAWMIKPINFDPNKKYPVYINIYGGPGSNMVSDDFDGNDYFYHQLLAQKGYIVLSVDPRGTMYRGAKFKKSTYLQLGKLETEDFISVAKELGKMTFVDASRIGIQGWSYGGYMTSLAMTKGADVFKMGIAVAPVTNWRFYDNIYTERFMRTPQENPRGYDENSPINFVKNIKGKYLIIHGSGDDNVHYQNTMEMISSLTDANVQFDMFIYPNKNHGIYGGNTRNHLFNMMFQYTLKNL
ncbi:MAG: S9 family peptidase [Flavobacteriia bacterium]|jgi:dipeptidyl-peptidase-4